MAKYVCTICGYTAEGEAPEKCPVCGAGKEAFTLMAEGVRKSVCILQWQDKPTEKVIRR